MILESAQALWRRLTLEPFQPMVDYASLTGPREENQDNLLILHQGRQILLREQEAVETPRPDWPTRWLRAAVFDGMGGHREGRAVAEAAAAGLATLPVVKNPRRQREAVLALHEQLARRFARDGDPANPGSTLVWLELDLLSGRGLLAQVGDSRACLYRNGQWHTMTHDHTLVEFNWRDGELDEADYLALRDEPGQRVAQALAYGSFGILADGRGIKPYAHDPALRLDLPKDLPRPLRDHADLRTLKLTTGDRLLLASDGLWSARFDWPVRADAEALAQAALAAGGRDNVTVVRVDWPVE